ncbi:MAG: hypothetical protein JXJ18_11195 [Rhodobacteraceae bacterium]|nr:hypothetical protein [Paracoccaceae bacterium]
MTADGFVEFEHLEANSSGTIVYGEIDLGVTGPDLGLGFDLGLDAVNLKLGSGSSEYRQAVYAALTYSYEHGKISVGRPRTLESDYIGRRVFGGSVLLDVQVGRQQRSIVDFFYLFLDETPVGLRYDGTYGDTRFGLAYHSFDDGAFDVYSIALHQDIGQYELGFFYEDFRGGHTASASASFTHGQWSGGVILSDTDLSAADLVGRFFVDYGLTDALTLSGEIGTEFGNGADDIYTLSMDYDFGSGAYLNAGVVASDGFDTVYDASLGFRF